MFSHILRQFFLSRNYTTLDLAMIGGAVGLGIQGQIFKGIVFFLVGALFSAILEINYGPKPNRMELTMKDGNPSLRFDRTVSDHDIFAVSNLVNLSIEQFKANMSKAPVKAKPRPKKKN